MYPRGKPYISFDLRELSSNKLQQVNKTILKCNNPLLFLSNRKEIITFDKLVSLSAEKLVVFHIAIYLDEETLNDFVLHYLFKTLSNEKFQVVFNIISFRLL